VIGVPDTGGHQFAELRTPDGPQQRPVDEARHRLLDMISSGALRSGDKLGTERELAARLSVSRSTLRQVLAVLGIGIAVVLATQVDLSKSLILGGTVGAALLNWAWARRADRTKV